MEYSNYIITTENEIMKALGLDRFTLEELIDWVEYDDNLNLGYLNMELGENPTTKQMIEGFIYNQITADSVLAGGIGVITGQIEEIFPFMNYQQDNIRFTNEIYRVHDTDGNWGYLGPLSDDTEYTADTLDLENDDLKVPNSRGYFDIFAYRIIRMHELVSSAIYSKDNAGTDKFRARKFLINDIMSAPEKDGYPGGVLQWMSEISFNVGADEPCIQDVLFEMRLFPKRDKIKKPVMVTTAMRAPNVDILGNPHLSIDGDGRKVYSSRKMEASVSAELDVHLNPFTGKLESGTKQMFAVMETDLDAAKAPANGLLADPDDFLLTNGEGYEPTLGRARPILMQKSNWRKWAPEWEFTTGGTETENTNVYKIPVQNKFTDTSFSRGQLVALSKIGGVWQPFSIKEGAVSGTTVATAVDKWSFDYLMTNAEFFFRKEGNTVDFGDYEEAFRDVYYGLSSDLTNLPTESNTHVQLTSFDFMGSSIGGNRDVHALGNTQIGIRHDSDEGDSALVMPIITSPFFGCVFPDGYDETKYDTELTVNLETTDNFYVQDVPIGVKLFDPTDGENYEGKIFSDGLTQLPADIALHCDPDNLNGSPINRVDIMASYFRATNTGILDEFMSTNSQRYAWLHEEGDSTIPAFDITPINNKKIQFRPLKLELYASMEIDTYSAVGTADRGYYGRKMWDRTNQKEPFAHHVITSRYGNVGGIFGDDGLKYNNDIINDLANNSSLFPEPRFRNTTYNWMASGPRPAGAFGIIGASCTVSANTSITFNTSYLFGMGEEYGGSQPPPFPPSLWYQTFGGSNTYRAHNNDGLFVRVYTNWPTELTVYDSRYFAVFHFNYGIGQQGDAAVVYNSGSVVVTEEKWGENPDDREYDDLYYSVQQVEFPQSDFREPSYAKADDKDAGILIPVGTTVFSDGDSAGVAIRSFSHWNVNVDSRGKLLPLPASTYTRNVIAINNIHVESSGANYVSTDRFTTSGGSGSGVTLAPILDGNTIIGFTIEDAGYDFRHSDFFTGAASDEVLLLDVGTGDNYQGADVRIAHKDGVVGNGLRAFVHNGTVVERDLAGDVSYPVLANPGQNGIRLIDNAPVEDDNNQNDGPAVGSKTTSITMANISSDSKYDCFFFYYNDASHAFDSDHGLQTPKPYEQYVELEISSE